MITVYAVIKSTFDDTVEGPSSQSHWQRPTVSVMSLSPVQAAIQWKNTNTGHDAVPDTWMITLSRSVEEREKKNSELATIYFYTLDGRTSKQKLPVCLTPCIEYTVTITPLFKTSSYIPDVPCHWLCGESTTTFTTPSAGQPFGQYSRFILVTVI